MCAGATHSRATTFMQMVAGQQERLRAQQHEILKELRTRDDAIKMKTQQQRPRHRQTQQPQTQRCLKQPSQTPTPLWLGKVSRRTTFGTWPC
jgi:hypothetical protein